MCKRSTSLPKVLIVDWDVHHGNGTQAAFNEDTTVLLLLRAPVAILPRYR